MKEADKIIAELEWFRSVLIKGGKIPEYYEAQSSILTKAIKLLEQTERKTGEWIPFNPDNEGFTRIYECSECNKKIQQAHYSRVCDFDICPHCGADMRGEADDEER